MAYTMEDLLSVLHPHGPVKVDALSKNRRRVEHGLTTLGLKIHCLGDSRHLLHLIDAEQFSTAAAAVCSHEQRGTP